MTAHATAELPRDTMLGPDRLDGLMALAERLQRDGANVAADPRVNILELVTLFGADAPAIVRWLPEERAVALVQPLELPGADLDLARTAVAVARINRALPVPALVLDVDSGAIEYRARVCTDGDGMLDYTIFETLLTTMVHAIERAALLFGEWLCGEDAALDAFERCATPTELWLGYSE